MSRRLPLIVAAIVLVGAGRARADGEPWSVGVTVEQKARAQELLDAGNALFVENKYAEALAKYQQAVAAWDHPAIRFNVVRCLIQLDRPVEAADNLEVALAFGAAPLQDQVYAEALSYRKLLARQIGRLEIVCDQPGVKLTLDGKTLATCPSRTTSRVAPGEHQVVGTRVGYLTGTIDRIVTGGDEQTVAVALVPLAQAARVVHRWPAWVPWAVLGGGVLVGGLGALVDWKAANDLDLYNQDLLRRCGTTPCSPTDVESSLRHSAINENRAGIALIVLGAAGAVTGGVLLYVNRGRTTYPTESALDVSPQRGGAVVSWQRSF